MNVTQVFISILLFLLFFGSITLFLKNCNCNQYTSKDYMYKTYPNNDLNDHTCKCEGTCGCKCNAAFEKIKIVGGVSNNRLIGKKYGFL